MFLQKPDTLAQGISHHQSGMLPGWQHQRILCYCLHNSRQMTFLFQPAVQFVYWVSLPYFWFENSSLLTILTNQKWCYLLSPCSWNFLAKVENWKGVSCTGWYGYETSRSVCRAHWFHCDFIGNPFTKTALSGRSLKINLSTCLIFTNLWFDLSLSSCTNGWRNSSWIFGSKGVGSSRQGNKTNWYQTSNLVGEQYGYQLIQPSTDHNISQSAGHNSEDIKVWDDGFKECYVKSE